MKTAKMTFSSIKDSDGWVELMMDLKFEKFKAENPELNAEELHYKFYKEEISPRFENGEYGNFEIIVDENLNIIGGKIY